MIPERPDARESPTVRGEIDFDQVAFAYSADAPVLQGCQFQDQAGPVGRCGGPDRRRQVHHRQPDSAILRSDVGRGEDRRRGCS